LRSKRLNKAQRDAEGKRCVQTATNQSSPRSRAAAIGIHRHKHRSLNVGLIRSQKPNKLSYCLSPDFAGVGFHLFAHPQRSLRITLGGEAGVFSSASRIRPMAYQHLCSYQAVNGWASRKFISTLDSLSFPFIKVLIGSRFLEIVCLKSFEKLIPNCRVKTVVVI
jgi:hypothetical protein